MDNKSVQRWLKASRQNLQVAKMIFSQNDQELYKFVGFHCQQSVEMSMKAFLTFIKFKFEKTHDLENLGKKILELHPDLEPLLIAAKDLTPYAVQIRYEEFLSIPVTEQMTEKALQIAGDLQLALIDRIK